MKQFLRSLCTLLLLMMWCSVGFAQTTVTFVNGTDATTAQTLSKDGVTLNVSKGTFDKRTTYYRSDRNSKFTVSSDKIIEKIVITSTETGDTKGGPKNASTTIGKYTVNDYIGTWTGSAKKIVFTIDNQLRMSKVEVTLEAEKTATTLTFPQSAINIEEGKEADFKGQTATLKSDEAVLNNAITYTTNNDAMFEEYDAKVGPTKLKTSAYGTATVTAKFNGDDTYEASTATYTVNYTEKEKPATSLDFGFTTKTVNIEEIFTAAATLKSGETAITGAVTYSSANPEVAYVDEATGEVMALTAGKAKITATFAGTSEYKSSTASYELTVVDPNAIVPLVFDKADDAFGTLENYNKDKKDISEYALIGSDGNSYTFKTTGGKTAAKNGNLQLQKTTGSLESPIFKNFENGYTVNITFSQGGTKPLTITSGGETKKADITSDVGDNTNGIGFLLSMNIKAGNTFTLKAGNAAYISKIEIVAIPGITLEEDADDTETKIKANNGKTQDVTLTRSLKAGAWNTICLPFDVTADQVESVLKATGNVKEFDKEDKATATIFFKPATEMKAGVPYLIKPTEDATVLNFKDVTINNVDELSRINGNDYCICGVFGKYAMKTNGTELFLNAAGKFVAPAAATNTMKGFRAYFMVPSGASAAAININIDGETTGINSIETNATVNGKVYNLNGQYVGNSLNGLKKGIYVVNGKKVIK